MGLLWAVPAWFVWDARASAAFIGLVGPASLLLDIDLWIERVAPSIVHHHGVTHTAVFVLLVSIGAAAIVAVLFTRTLLHRRGSDRFDTRDVFVFVFGAFLLGGLSHLFTDMLSAPDIAQPIEPFWPFIDKAWSIDVIWYNTLLWNLGCLTAVLLLHLLIVYVVSLKRPGVSER